MSDDGAQPGEVERSLAQRTLDAVVFAPAGFILSAVEDLPEMAAKGRARLEGQVRNAHVLGQFAVSYGRRDLTRRLARLTGGREAPVAPSRSPSPTSTTAAPDQAVSAGMSTGPAPGPGTTPPTPLHAVPPAGPALAIPDYDTLSASQVVRRLDGLAPPELEAVYHHEAATRGRRTILHRAQQLLGVEDVPGR